MWPQHAVCNTDRVAVSACVGNQLQSGPVTMAQPAASGGLNTLIGYSNATVDPAWHGVTYPLSASRTKFARSLSPVIGDQGKASSDAMGHQTVTWNEQVYFHWGLKDGGSRAPDHGPCFSRGSTYHILVKVARQMALQFPVCGSWKINLRNLKNRKNETVGKYWGSILSHYVAPSDKWFSNSQEVSEPSVKCTEKRFVPSDRTSPLSVRLPLRSGMWGDHKNGGTSQSVLLHWYN